MNWNLLQFRNKPIFEQLQLEEALLRTCNQNYCIINHGSPLAVVMGLSAKASDWVHLDKIKEDQVTLIQRFSGGGTVVVDQNTIFVTFIAQKSILKNAATPESVLKWSAAIYKNALGIPDFSLVENDYTIAGKKCAGNAQYFTKDRFLHHSTFLYDYSAKNMEYLPIPARQPQYRKNRDHTSFLTTLKPYVSPNSFTTNLIQELKNTCHLDKNWCSTSFPVHRQSVKKVFV